MTTNHGAWLRRGSALLMRCQPVYRVVASVRVAARALLASPLHTIMYCTPSGGLLLSFPLEGLSTANREGCK